MASSSQYPLEPLTPFQPSSEEDFPLWLDKNTPIFTDTRSFSHLHRVPSLPTWECCLEPVSRSFPNHWIERPIADPSIESAPNWKSFGLFPVTNASVLDLYFETPNFLNFPRIGCRIFFPSSDPLEASDSFECSSSASRHLWFRFHIPQPAVGELKIAIAHSIRPPGAPPLQMRLEKLYFRPLVRSWPQSFLHLGTFPLGTLLTHREDRYQGAKYLGYTICGDLVFKLNQQFFQTGSPSAFFDFSSIQPYNHPPPAPTSPSVYSVVCKLQGILQKQTIRGVPIMSLLFHLRQERGVTTPIYVVGGAVRDAFLGKSSADIDLVVCSTWHDLEKEIQGFFTAIGTPLTDGDFERSGLRKSFGMMKINPILGVDQDALDIGLCKSIRVPDKLVGKPSHAQSTSNKYLYGLDLKSDAKSRDFTFNAIYYDPFKQVLLDPLETGISDIENGIARCCNPQDLRNDLGGCFRLYKQICGGFESDPASLAAVQQTLSALVGKLEVEPVDDPLASGPAQTPLSSSQLTYTDWFLKLSRKLFSGQTDFSRRAADIHQYAQDCEWWQRTMDLAHAILKGSWDLIPSVTADSNDHRLILQTLQALSDLRGSIEF